MLQKEEKEKSLGASVKTLLNLLCAHKTL